MTFPKKLVGNCPICGGVGNEYVSDDELAYVGDDVVDTDESPSSGSPVLEMPHSAYVDEVLAHVVYYYPTATPDVNFFIDVRTSDGSSSLGESLRVKVKASMAEFGQWFRFRFSPRIAVVSGTSYLFALDSENALVLLLSQGKGTARTAYAKSGGVWTVLSSTVKIALYVRLASGLYPFPRQGEVLGYDLVEYNGQQMCKICKKRLMSYDENKPMTDWMNKEEVFLKKVGFTDGIVD